MYVASGFSRTIMTPRTLYAFVVGGLVGAAPLWVTPAWASSPGHPMLLWAGLAFLLSATAFGSFGAWALGMILGILGSWTALAVLAGVGWLALPYIVIAFERYYAAATAGVGIAWALAEWSRSRKRSA